jgi:hypothetical protein
MLKWLSCAACRAKDAEIERYQQREKEFFALLQAQINPQKNANSAESERRTAVPGVRRMPREVVDQQHLLGRPNRKPPWGAALANDGHLRQKRDEPA